MLFICRKRTEYEVLISDGISEVCSADLPRKRSQRHAKIVEGKRRRAPLGWLIIDEERICGRCQAGLANPHSDTPHQKLGKASREAAGDGEPAPDENGKCHDLWPEIGRAHV